MGAKQAKIDGSYLPDTPKLNRMPMVVTKNASGVTEFNNDPRSPNDCRTPIVIKPQQQQTINCSENPFGALRRRLLRGFSCNLIDPRSPNFNRTLMQLDEATERTFNLDDTFADLFVESRAPASKENECLNINETIEVQNDDDKSAPTNSSLEIVSLTCDEKEHPSNEKLPKTPIILQQAVDPRSPTFGVDRTPIIFSDEDEMHEDQMLENVLATLSLNLSNASSVVSFASATSDLEEHVEPEQRRVMQPVAKATNKHIERVRLGKQRIGARKATRNIRIQRIHEDVENTAPCTPKQKESQKNDVNEKRTPLSCVKNRAHLRLPLAENPTKTSDKQLLIIQTSNEGKDVLET